MKHIYLIGFRGVGFADDRFKKEYTLIRAGHVGIAFEGEEGRIIGFHPTREASAKIGDDEAVIEWLKEHNILLGALHDDTYIFERAYEMAQVGERTHVWQMAIPVEDEDFERIRQQVNRWYTENTTFNYGFPRRGEEPPTDQDNCATFFRRVGLPLPEPTGQLTKYIAALEAVGTEWKPKGN